VELVEEIVFLTGKAQTHALYEKETNIDNRLDGNLRQMLTGPSLLEIASVFPEVQRHDAFRFLQIAL